MTTRLVKWNFRRRFGIEYEFNNSDAYRSTMRDILREQGMNCDTRGWEHTRNNSCWVAKTDSSCGTELVSPILKGVRDLKQAAEILPHLRNGGMRFNNSCGCHIHVEIADFNRNQAGILAAHWIKIERFLINGTPSHRRNNNYCRLSEDMFESHRPNRQYDPSEIYQLARSRRQSAINFQRHNPGDSGTVEFRFGEMTFDPEVIKNRVRFLIWFVEMCKTMPNPSNLNWMSPKEALKYFNLYQDEEFEDIDLKVRYSNAIQSMRKWLLHRVTEHACDVFQRDREMCQEILREIESKEAEEVSEMV